VGIINDPALKLSAFERECALRWPECEGSELELTRRMFAAEIAELADCPSRKKRDAFLFDAQRRVRWALRRVAGRVDERYAELREAAAEFRREVFSGVRNSRSTGRTAQTFAGVKPYGALDDEELASRRTSAEFRAALKDTRNYRAVSLRGAVATRADLPAIPAAEKLLHLARHCAAQAELFEGVASTP
jgi:hypothetical protein